MDYSNFDVVVDKAFSNSGGNAIAVKITSPVVEINIFIKIEET